MANIIFRQKFQEGQQRWRGEALITSFYSGWFVNGVAILFITIFIILIIFANYTRRTNVNGEVITQFHPVNIYAPQQGYINQRLVNVGERVTKGTALYSLDVSRVTNGGKVSQTTITVIEDQLKKLDELTALSETNKNNALNNIQNQLVKHQQIYKKTQQFVDKSANELIFLSRNLEEYKQFLKKGLIRKDEVNYQRYLYQQQQNTHQNFYSQLIQEELQITNLTNELTAIELNYTDQLLQYQYRRYELEKQLAEITASDMIIITAPHEGQVESLSVTNGQMVNIGDSLAQLLPLEKNSYYGVLWLPDESVPYINAGDNINLRYQAFPFEKYGQFAGEIVSVSSVPASRQEMSSYHSAPRNLNGQQDNPYYKVIIKLSEPQLANQQRLLSLTSGMTFQSTLFLDERPIYQWILAPYFNMQKSIQGPVNE